MLCIGQPFALPRLSDGPVGIQLHEDCIRSFGFVNRNMHICTGGATICHGVGIILYIFVHCRCQMHYVFLTLYIFLQGWREVLGFLGDMGSPLMCDTTDDDWRLYGVATYHDPECDNTHPSVFTRLSSFRTWINRESGEYKTHLRMIAGRFSK